MKLDLIIVDDSKLWLSVAENLARVHPKVESVVTFEDALDAWIFLQTNQSSVLMTDIEMPWMNGLSFLSMFSNKLPTISTSTKKEYKQHALELGCVTFLSKPFSKTKFNHALTDIYEKISLQKT